MVSAATKMDPGIQLWKSYVGGTTFGHRPKAHAQFECNDKVSSRLRAKTEAPAARTGSPQAKTKRSEEW